MGSDLEASAVDGAAARRVRFGAFEADLRTGELWRDGVTVPVQDLPFRVLATLIERPGDVVSRAELTARLWGPDTFVDAAAGLNTAVAKLREALGDDADRPAFVETLPRRGYRFVARLGAVDPAEPVAPAPATPATPGPGAQAAALDRPRRRPSVGAVVLLAAIAAIVGAASSYRGWTARPAIRVAVVLFDNETGRPEIGPLAQALTDATVMALTAERRLAVIGNAAVLRTARPFRDIAVVRDALDADYVIIGQVQRRDADLVVRTHLIRAGDQAHVGVDEFVRGAASEAELEARVSTRVRSALMAQLPAGSVP